jgi:hypothetical protein
MTVLQVHSLPVLANQHRQISFWRLFLFHLVVLSRSHHKMITDEATVCRCILFAAPLPWRFCAVDAVLGSKDKGHGGSIFGSIEEIESEDDCSFP